MNPRSFMEYLRQLPGYWSLSVSSIVGCMQSLFGFPMYGTDIIVFLITLDWVLGVMLAVSSKTLCYQKFKGGLWKLLLYAILLMIACRLRQHTGLPADQGMMALANIMSVYVILTELLSVLRNFSALAIWFDVPMPGFDRIICIVQQWQQGQLPKGEVPKCHCEANKDNNEEASDAKS